LQKAVSYGTAFYIFLLTKKEQPYLNWHWRRFALFYLGILLCKKVKEKVRLSR